jgi:hypothetical protein
LREWGRSTIPPEAGKFGRSLDAQFEKRSPWPIRGASGRLASRRFGGTYSFLQARIVA